MYLRNLTVRNFRRYSKSIFSFAPSINVITGPNGSGKTTILEAINVLSVSRSFRTRKDRLLIREGEDFFAIDGEAEDVAKDITVHVDYQRSGSKHIAVNQSKLDQVRDLLGILPVVLFVPEDLSIAKDSDVERRIYLDRILSTTDKTYLGALVKYRHCLKQRNASLRTGHNSAALAKIWDRPLAESAAIVWSIRRDFVADLQPMLSEIGYDLELGKELKFQYTLPNYAGIEEMLERLHDTIDTDMNWGRTSSGPHADNIVLKLENKDLRLYGSLGEQKLYVTILKLSEARIISERLGKAPILLLDDLFATLDRVKSEIIFRYLVKGYQTIVSTTDMGFLNEGDKYLDHTNHIDLSEQVQCQA